MGKFFVLNVNLTGQLKKGEMQYPDLRVNQSMSMRTDSMGSCI